jgi:molybdopterin synthase catalytic subunit
MLPLPKEFVDKEDSTHQTALKVDHYDQIFKKEINGTTDLAKERIPIVIIMVLLTILLAHSLT